MTAPDPSVTRRRWPTLAAATAIAVVALCAIWLDAAPRGLICPAIHPAPGWCTAEGRRVAVIAWTVGVGLAYAITAALYWVGRARAGAALVGMVVVGAVAYLALLGPTGFSAG